MKVDSLYLEITRNCTIECEHCLRGDKEQKNMTPETLENILKNIREIKTLLLSGGEPLLAITILESLPKLIEKYHIKIETIGIISNGTVCSNRHIEALEKIKESCSNFKFFLSSDLFHRLEWKRLGLEEKVSKNFEKYHQIFQMEKFLENDRFHNITLNLKGRAEHLTPERIQKITENQYINYDFAEVPVEGNIEIEQESIYGKVCIDVNGNIVDYSASYEEEDIQSEKGFNTNQIPLKNAVKLYISDIKSRRKVYQKNNNIRNRMY